MNGDYGGEDGDDDEEEGNRDTVEINGVQYSTKLQKNTVTDDSLQYELPSKWR